MTHITFLITLETNSNIADSKINKERFRRAIDTILTGTMYQYADGKTTKITVETLE